MIPARSRQEWVAHVKKVEDLGYSTLCMGQHPAWGGIEPTVALMAAADATTTLRIASLTFTNDLHHPVLLAQAATTLDVLSDGRLEFGLGAGWLRSDYDVCGIPFEAASVRIDRLEEAVHVVKGMWSREPFRFTGRHYQVTGPQPPLEPKQRPHPPLLLGGGGRRMLTLAARQADIVGLDPKGTPSGSKDLGTMQLDAIDEQIAWIREAAGTRFPQLEIQSGVLAMRITNDRGRGAEEIAAWLSNLPPVLVPEPRTPDQILGSLQFLVGSLEEIIEELHARRERYGISYVTVFGEDVEAFSPVVARLAGR